MPYVGREANSFTTVVDVTVSDDLTVTDDATIGGTALVTGVLTTTAATVFNGGFAANDGCTITTADNSNQLTLISTDADGSAGPVMEFYRNSSSAADSDATGLIYFTGENDADEKVYYGQIFSQIQDASNGTEDSSIDFITMVAGTGRSRMYFLPAETVFNEASVDLDFRVESNGNANMLFVDGGNNAVGIGTTNVDATNNFTVLGNFNSNFIRNVTSGNRGYNINIGGINGSGTNIIGATISGEVDSGDATGQLAFKTRTSGSVSEKMRIDSSGNVGIGTTAINAGIDIAAKGTFTGGNQHTYPTGNAYIKVQGTVNEHNWIGIEGGYNGSSGSANLFLQGCVRNVNEQAGNYIASEVQAAADCDITFGKLVAGANTSTRAAKSEHMRIDSSGNLLVGTTSSIGTAVAKLEILGASSGGRCINTKTAITTSANAISFNNGNGQVGSIATNGSATAYNTSSDYRLKENIVTDWDATSRLKQLKPSRFNFIADADTTVDGFLAHEAQAVVPECVTGTKDEVDDDGVAVMQGIDQSKLVPLLVKTIQELEARITALEG